jgi:hypothetical protein
VDRALLVRKMRRRVAMWLRRTLFPDTHYLPRASAPINSLREISDTDINDIFVVGYPKSGNTWMQNLLACLVYGIDPQFLPDHLTQILVPDVHSQRYYTRFLAITCFKTHDLPKPKYQRVIHLVRDGRDVMASYYAYNKVLRPTEMGKMIKEGAGLFPTKWYEHCRQWIENPYNAEILLVRYEDLLNDLHTQLVRICEYVGLERNDDLIARVITGSSFEAMQRNEKTFGRYDPKWPKEQMFIRKGKSDRYLDEIPYDLVGWFEVEAGEYLRHFGYSVT